MTSDPLSGTMHYRENEGLITIELNLRTDDVRAHGNWLDEISSHPECIINDQRDAIVVGNLTHGIAECHYCSPSRFVGNPPWRALESVQRYTLGCQYSRQISLSSCHRWLWQSLQDCLR